MKKRVQHVSVRGDGESIWGGVLAYVVLKGLLGAENS